MTPKEHASNLVDKIKYAYFNEDIDEKTSLHIVKHELQKALLEDRTTPYTIVEYLEAVKREIKSI
jgi:adenylate cyclase